MDEAVKLFNAGHFALARDRFRETASTSTWATFLASLSETYRAWCDLDLEALPAALDDVWYPPEELSDSQRERLHAQVDLLRWLCNGEPAARAAAFLVVGDHHQRMGRHDLGALFHYRAIEGCFGARLAARGIDPARPDYGKLDVSGPELMIRYREVTRHAGHEQGEMSLPGKLGCVSSAALLLALDDPVMAATSLEEIRDVGDIRNRSILVHGEEPVTPEGSARLGEVARRIVGELLGEPEALDGLGFLRFGPD